MYIYHKKYFSIKNINIIMIASKNHKKYADLEIYVQIKNVYKQNVIIVYNLINV